MELSGCDGVSEGFELKENGQMKAIAMITELGIEKMPMATNTEVREIREKKKILCSANLSFMKLQWATVRTPWNSRANVLYTV